MSQRSHFYFWLVCLLVLAATGTSRLIGEDIEWDDKLPPDWSYEGRSPEERLPATVEQGLRRRAIPLPEPEESPEEPLGRELRDLTQSFQQTAIDRGMASAFSDGGTSPFFRLSQTYLPPLGLQPRIFPPGVIEISLWAGLSQSFETNVTLTSEDPIADFYLTPRAGVVFQLGTPDSIFIEQYDTIWALHGEYEAYADLFYLHPGLSAFNERLDLSGRIGRGDAIWRPFVSASDLTGSNLLMAELVNRTRRIRVNTGVNAQYRLTDLIGWNQNFSYSLLEHPDPGYINNSVWRTLQEVSYLALHDVRALAWAEYRFTRPDQGDAGSEVLAGLGWAGRPDPRLYTELRLGWDTLALEGSEPGRKNLSGLRFNGYTTFDWSPRFRPTFRYDRDYVFNEVDVNDNYVSTLLQLKGELFLGGNWFITPYFGISIQEYETSQRMTLQYRPEIEISYAFPDAFKANERRIYLKIGYMRSQNLRGDGDPVENIRLSMGCHWRF
jgi:hypothetical protein